MNKHSESCEAPICVLDKNLNYKKEVVWRPGESVCSNKPRTKIQSKQILINKELSGGTFKNHDIALTASDLESRSI